MGFNSFEDLDVWRKSYNLTIKVFQNAKHIRSFPLKNQITRSILSVPSNIAEGYDRDSNKDFIRFLRIAKGSASEFKTQLYIVRDLGYFNEALSNEMIQEIKNISSMLYGLIKSVQKRDLNE